MQVYKSGHLYDLVFVSGDLFHNAALNIT